jgi:L-asparaginase
VRAVGYGASVQRVTVISLGGTIASVAPEGGGPVAPGIGAADLVAAVPGLAGLGVEVSVTDLRRLPGSELSLADVRAVAVAASAAVGGGADGVVVTQGTDTIEETSFALDLLWDGEAPLVVTGAMRHGALAGADGPGNLLAAVATAASPAARGLGCVVAFADEIHAARTVRKAHTTSTGAFVSPGAGPLGWVTEGVPWFAGLPVRPAVPALERVRDDVRVPVATAVIGDDGTLLGALRGAASGVVVAAFGAGHVPSAWVGPLEALAAEVPVVLSSRTGAGRVARQTYGFPGSESDLLSRGLIPAGPLDPAKSRVLLTLLLESGTTDRTIRETFAAF